MSVGIPFIKNTTKVVKYSKVCVIAWRTCPNVAELPLLMCNYIIFSQYVPSYGKSDYDLFSETTDVVNEFIS